MTRLVTPSVHLNGTSKEGLVKQLLDAIEAARQLHNALHRASPNARDYYPQGEGVANAAATAWVERMKQVEALESELTEHAMRITLG